MQQFIFNGSIISGFRHGDCIHLAVKIFPNTKIAQDAQGFLTSKGRWVDRDVASEIACNAGQILKDKGMLLSEDLY